VATGKRTGGHWAAQNATRQLDGEYRLDHAVTKTQTEILSAFNIEASHVKYKVAYINDALKGA
jgi:hypothetical protein